MPQYEKHSIVGWTSPGYQYTSLFHVSSMLPEPIKAEDTTVSIDDGDLIILHIKKDKMR
jgi:hypothetical protein